ncbi:MAG: ACP S-malonyltransferase [Bdellovibrionia bacterium]
MTKRPNVFAVFPGQGSQHVGMVKDLFDQFAMARETFEEASDATGLHIKKLCFEGPESELTLTENTQPCLLTASVAAFRVAQSELGFFPSAVAGHSLGEYSALVAAGSLTLADAARWVRSRGQAMQKAVPVGEGTMAAVLSLSDDQVLELCQVATEEAQRKRNAQGSSSISVEARVEPANFNAPGQVVIAGSTDGVAEALALVKSDPRFAGGKTIPLQVSAPFHSSLMKPARDRMAEIFSHLGPQQKPKTLSCPYVPNRTARITQEPEVVLELLVEQVDHPVLWRPSVQVLLDAGFTHAIEFGPGKVLCGLIKRIASQSQKPCIQQSVQDATTLKALEKTLEGGLS